MEKQWRIKPSKGLYYLQYKIKFIPFWITSNITLYESSAMEIYKSIITCKIKYLKPESIDADKIVHLKKMINND